MFKLEFKTDNAAFYPSVRMEITAILRGLAKKIDEGEGDSDHGLIIDSNGNRVGDWELEHDAET